MSKTLLIESWLDPDPDDRITIHALYEAAKEALQVIEDLEAENERLTIALVMAPRPFEVVSYKDTYSYTNYEHWFFNVRGNALREPKTAPEDSQ